MKQTIFSLTLLVKRALVNGLRLGFALSTKRARAPSRLLSRSLTVFLLSDRLSSRYSANQKPEGEFEQVLEPLPSTIQYHMCKTKTGPWNHLLKPMCMM